VFPQEAAQFHLLETIGTVGMVLLLLLTGLETDLKLLKNLGRAAFVASLMGMVVPFASGFVLGELMPDRYLALPDRRVLFSLFLATAMSISAMPVIAKILMDLDLTKRNIGLVILSAGVVDDTAGWLILSVIAGAATRGSADLVSLGVTVGLMLAFVAGAALILYPLARVLVPLAQRARSGDAELVLVVIVTLVGAAVTEHIGVHAVFGAFVVGTVFRQVTQLRAETVHKLESFVLAVLAPVFFGVVGLKVDLWALAGGGGAMLAIVVGVACFGKLVGCTLGGLWGGLRFWEAVSIAVAMNARGAMELVVATIGLTLGLLNQQMFSMIVVVAISTSFLAPLLLRLTMRMVQLTADEIQRIAEEQSKGAFDPLRVKVLVPTAGGPNATEAMRVGVDVSSRSDLPVQILYVDRAERPWWARLPWMLAKDEDARTIDAHLAMLEQLAEGAPHRPNVRRIQTRDVGRAIVAEAKNDFDLVLMGASQRGQLLGGQVLHDVVEGAPCHVAILRAKPDATRFSRILVPVDGSVAARVAVELAVRYAEASGAALTLAVLSEQQLATPVTLQAAAAPASPGKEARLTSQAFVAPARTPDEELERISVVFRSSKVRPSLLRVSADPESNAVSDLAASGGYDLVVLGAENRAIKNRLFFGHDSERLLARMSVAAMIVVPNIARLR
jgi:Kef-type K+ transport system membrane component KefB/nucleotide-binding universal stress UspA family protein